MKKELEILITNVYKIEYTRNAIDEIYSALRTLEAIINSNYFLNSKSYLLEIENIADMSNELSSFKSDADRLLQKQIQKRITNLSRKILDENKKIFVVHGRNHQMRDKLAALLGKLKLDYVILESEHNNGATIIEKFLKSAEDCGYAIVLFSADEVGKLNEDEGKFRFRTRQNVILELGFFLNHVGRKNIVILHEHGRDIEKPSDFDGVVYEPFDEFGAWKGKLLKEMKKAGFFIDPNLAEKV